MKSNPSENEPELREEEHEFVEQYVDRVGDPDRGKIIENIDRNIKKLGDVADAEAITEAIQRRIGTP